MNGHPPAGGDHAAGADDAGPPRIPRSRGWRALVVAFRSLLFLALALATLVVVTPLTPLLAMPRGFVRACANAIIRFWLWLLGAVAGLRYEVRGRENLAAAGPCLIASKHQSAFETLALQIILDDPAIVLKRELTRIPVAGWTMWRLRHIGINRKAGAAALVDLVRQARKRLAEGRPVVIFPEGTRAAPFAAPHYKPGVVALYRALKVPCLPIALNSGVFWPRNSFWRFPGTIVVEIMPAIPAGLDSGSFSTRLESAIETRTAELVTAALSRGAPPPPRPVSRATVRPSSALPAARIPSRRGCGSSGRLPARRA